MCGVYLSTEIPKSKQRRHNISRRCGKPVNLIRHTNVMRQIRSPSQRMNATFLPLLMIEVDPRITTSRAVGHNLLQQVFEQDPSEVHCKVLDFGWHLRLRTFHQTRRDSVTCSLRILKDCRRMHDFMTPARIQIEGRTTRQT